MKFALDKYRFFGSGDTIIAVSTYAGKTVRGVAKCDPRDSFDAEAGKELAAARCNLKIANKRAARATKKLAEADRQVLMAEAYRNRMASYKQDSDAALVAATNTVEDIMNKM